MIKNLYSWDFPDEDFFSNEIHNIAANGYTALDGKYYKGHNGQFRKYGQKLPYIIHPEAVETIAVARWKLTYPAATSNVNIGIIKSVSFGHDLDEDTEIKLIIIAEALQRIGVYKPIADRILTAIKALTKKPENFNLIEYLNGIKYNIYALTVKLADLEHNMSDLTDIRKLNEYKLIYYYLTH